MNPDLVRLLSRLFDGDWYESQIPESANHPRGSFGYFLEQGVKNPQISPHPLFNAQWYKSKYIYGSDQIGHPLIYYLERGSTDGDRPHLLFDTAFYLKHVPLAQRYSEHPLIHFLEKGYRHNYQPHCLFDMNFYRQKVGLPEDINPLLHYFRTWQENLQDPHLYFSTAEYLERSPETKTTKLSPLEHFLSIGFKKGIDPSPLSNSVRTLISDRHSQPLVSIIMPTQKRVRLLIRAVESVLAQSYHNWELLVIGDGATPEVAQVMQKLASHDHRIQIHLNEHSGGVSVARNRGLAVARGEFIAYLDDDNYWLTHHLARLVHCLLSKPSVMLAYDVVLKVDWQSEQFALLCRRFRREVLQRQNYIDLNSVCHRRVLWEKLGGFDEFLTRLVDWELLQRYCSLGEVATIPAIGMVYRAQFDQDRISSTEPYTPNLMRVNLKQSLAKRKNPRILYIVYHYPHLSETYIESEIQLAQANGFEVKVWSRVLPTTPYPTDIEVIYNRSLLDTITELAPDLLHFHWLNQINLASETLLQIPIPWTARGHGFEFQPDLVLRLASHPLCMGIVLFPHQKQSHPQLAQHPKIISLNQCWQQSLLTQIQPQNKDPRLIVRTGAGLRTKELEMILRLAQLNPDYRFVLVAVHCAAAEIQADELKTFNDKLGSPAEVIFDYPHDQTLNLLAQAGVYLHTFRPGTLVGNSVSIFEAMYLGCEILLRDHPVMRDLGSGHAFYYQDLASAHQVLAQAVKQAEKHSVSGNQAIREYVTKRFNLGRTFTPLMEIWSKNLQKSAAPHTLRIFGQCGEQ